MIIYIVTDANRVLQQRSVDDTDGNPIGNAWNEYSCDLNYEHYSTWNGDLSEDAEQQILTADFLQALIDQNGLNLIGKTITVDIADPDGNVVQVK